jgi:hypothetical protein
MSSSVEGSSTISYLRRGGKRGPSQTVGFQGHRPDGRARGPGRQAILAEAVQQQNMWFMAFLTSFEERAPAAALRRSWCATS